MFRRGLALSLVLGMGSIVQAGALVELRPSASTNPFNPCGSFSAGEVVTVEVFLSQTGTVGDHFLRMVQLDFTASNAALSIPTSMTWTNTINHFAHLDGAGTDSRLSNTYHGDLITPNLGRNTTDQFLLPGDGTSVKVGEMQLTMPATGGSFTLDVLNSLDTNADRGGQVRFGFGLGVTTEPVTVWREGMLTGGQLTLDVVDQALQASAPNDQGVLFRSTNNVIELTFDRDLAGPVTGVEIREMQPSGALGADLSSNFSFTINNDGGGNPRILTIQDVSASGVLAHLSWYTALNTGSWTAVDKFKVQYKVLLGDVNGDGLLLNNDAGLINLEIPCFFACNPSVDVNGDGLILNNDAGLANLNIPIFFVAKPTGHDCQ